jgi:hypothetical protein
MKYNHVETNAQPVLAGKLGGEFISLDIDRVAVAADVPKARL